MRALGLHRDVIVCVSRVWQTTCTILRAPGEPEGEAFLIDSPIYPDELEALPGLLTQAGFAVSGLLATHADWDHLLGRLAYPEATVGCAETTVQRLAAEPGVAQRELRSFDEAHYVRRDRPLGLGQLQPLPVPGHCSLGQAELELHPTGGHTADGMCVWAPWAEVLVCGDHLSPLEIPMISPGGGIRAYLATLGRLEALVRRAEHVVPGHGTPMDRDAALALLEEDVAYLQALDADPSAAVLPRGRRNVHQRTLHAANVTHVTGA